MYSDLTVGDYLNDNRSVKAVAEGGGNSVFIHDYGSLWSKNGRDNLVIITHEAIHNITGLVDDDIGRAFSIKPGVGGMSNAISKAISKKCF